MKDAWWLAVAHTEYLQSKCDEHGGTNTTPPYNRPYIIFSSTCLCPLFFTSFFQSVEIVHLRNFKKNNFVCFLVYPSSLLPHHQYIGSTGNYLPFHFCAISYLHDIDVPTYSRTRRCHFAFSWAIALNHAKINPHRCNRTFHLAYLNLVALSKNRPV